MTAEALVIGGGLAGCAAAITLANAGRDVTLVERESTPKHKVCGEFLSREALAYLPQLDIDVAALGAVPIHSVRFGGRSRASLPFAAMSLTRRTLDEALLQRACAAGVRVLRGHAVESLTGHRAQLSHGADIHASAIFLATGKHDLRGHPRPAGRQPKLLALKMYYRLSPQQAAALHGHVELLLYPGGYAGLQPVESGAANLCCLIDRETFRSLGATWEALLAHMQRHAPSLHARLHNATPLLDRPLAISSIPYGFVRERTDGHWHLGDQAAVIPSFTGDGMSIALHTGILAARMFLAGDTAEAFQRKVRDDLHRSVARATWLSLGLVQNPRTMEAAARLWPGALKFIAAATRIPRKAMLVGSSLDRWHKEHDAVSNMHMSTRKLLTAMMAVVCLLAVVVAVVWFTHPPGRLEASISVDKADYGIPGITKVYDASIRNTGGRPIPVSRCNFVDDTNVPGVMVSYALDRWDSASGQWKQLYSESKRWFCKPAPLSIIRANFVRRWLWPGQSLSIGEEATAARDGLKLGDHVRFVIFTDELGDRTHSISTPEFVIDERPTEDFSPRIRH